MSSKTGSIRALLLLLVISSAATNALAETAVPDELKPWEAWVLQDKAYRNCPFLFDQLLDKASAFVCAWPDNLQLDIDGPGARFVQQWTVYAEQQWLALPGSAEHWPDRVTANDRPIEVVARDNVPSIKLAPGRWRVAGRFQWQERPAALPVPPRSALIDLTVDGKSIARPEVNRNNVYLGERHRETRARDAVQTTVHRLVVDDIPTRLVTQLQIDVSGSVREEVFGPVLPAGFIPLNIDSPLPAKLEADGNLRLQIRPGRWTISVVARGSGVEETIRRPPDGVNLAAEEIWSYRSNDRLRVTAVEGLPPVDPSQVDVPSPWQSLPAFRMSADAEFSVTERSRGIVSASNELQLFRTMWLAFDGDGFVVEDRISGQMRTHWRLDMNAPYALLSATENDQNLLITNSVDGDQTGVEVRHSNVNVAAIGQANTRDELPVNGWDTRFANVSATLNLPPGNKLLMAAGVDRAAGSWMSKWQLLDFFLVLIITIAVWRLFGTGPAAIALGALVLSFHELNAPVWLWLNLLIGIALMRVAPVGRLRQLVSAYQTLSVVALVVVLVPFIAGQLRVAIYPQLEPQAMFYSHTAGFAGRSPEAVSALKPDQSSADTALLAVEPERRRMAEFAATASMRKANSFSRYASNAIVQAGPGIPSWNWNSYQLQWSGPVNADQSMHLVVMPRWLVSSLRVAAIALLLLFAGVLAAEILNRRWALPFGLTLGSKQAGSFFGIVMLAGVLSASPDAHADYPDAAMLLELENRLLEAPDCVPRCAEIVSAAVDIGAATINMTLAVHALENIAIPLPGSSAGWRPEAISVDGNSRAQVFRASNNALWLQVRPGRHTITLRGAIPSVDSLEIPFQAPPRVIEVDSEAWFVAGIKDRRLVSGSLQLTRLQSSGESDGAVRWESSRFPAFARVERVLELDLDWRVRTTVYRVAPARGALTLDIPLLDGETLLSGDFTVTDNGVLVSMNPQQQTVSWTSNLPLQSPLNLQAASGVAWQETWQFAVGSSWNAEFEGIPQSNTNVVADGVRVAVYHPRGGEQLTLFASRPEASAGSTLAFDSVSLGVVEGNRSRDVSLHLDYRSTRGSQHLIQLPVVAELSSVVIDGREQTLRADEGRLTLEILPGNHQVSINWREAGGLGLVSSTPIVNLGAPASNINLTVEKSDDRWLLGTRGPKLGPAVLYWSELVALVVFALILGRVSLTPLTTRHWLLLGLGFSTFNWSVLMLVVVWLLLCGVREKMKPDSSWWKFNLTQLVIAAATLAALASVVVSLPAGLLGTPDMHIAGHSSYGNTLNWFDDRSASVLPVATVISVPMLFYKVMILLWALWLSFALLRWLPWVWQCFSADGYWRSRRAQMPQGDTDKET